MKRRYHLDTPAILLLFCVFAGCILLVLVLGARAYQGMTERDQTVIDGRTAQQYMLAKLRRQDYSLGRPVVTDLDGNPVSSGPAIVFYSDEDGTLCKTMIYAMDGHVYEIFTLAGLPFSPGDGEYILDAESLGFEDTGKGIRVMMTDSDGDLYDFYMSFRSNRSDGEVGVDE